MMAEPDLHAAAVAAELLIRPHVRETPVEPAWWSPSVLLKFENLQTTGSFKLRGAMHKLLTLAADQRDRGVVAASSGNHGLAVAHGAQVLGVAATVFVPTYADSTKCRRIAELGAEIVVVGDDCVDTEAAARRFADEHGRCYLSPYNDLDVIAGQGTVAVELARQVAPLDVVYIALGGGGLAAGIAGYLARQWPDTEIVGCSPANSAVLQASIAAGCIVELPSLPTLSDSTAGGLEAGSVTFDLCRRLIHRYRSVSEAEIAVAMRDCLSHRHMLIEGAAAVAVAGCRQDRPGRDARVGVIVCGANASLEQLRRVLAEG